MRKDILEKREQIEQWIAEELPKSEIARKLGCKQETLNLYLDKLHISYPLHGGLPRDRRCE